MELIFHAPKERGKGETSHIKKVPIQRTVKKTKNLRTEIGEGK